MLGERNMSTSLRILLGLLLAAGLAACGADPAPEAAPADEPAPTSERRGPPEARWDLVDMMREDAAQPRHASDGGGSARLVRDKDQKPYATSATPDRFTIVYDVGPLGIAMGGAIYLQVSPFWDWSTPQVLRPDGRGYTKIEHEDPEISLRAETVDRQLLMLENTGRPLVEGDSIRIIYGAGLAGAMPDRYAERDSPFWIAVDGDGDGVRAVLRDSPTIDVRPGKTAGIVCHVPTIARPGETVRITLAVVDAWRNTGISIEGDIDFEVPAGLEMPESVALEPGHEGRIAVEAIAREPGTYRLRANAGPMEIECNPLVVTADGPRVLWGDLHGHTNYTDGTGVPEDYFVYARDVSGLDVVALTDHDHWGILPLVNEPELWADIKRQTRRFHEPGRFVTLLGFEWTSWIHGHRHVLYFEDEGEMFSSLEPRYESPLDLWKALEGKDALTFAHHSAGGPIATNWDIPPDPRFEPLTEIVSIHGSSEAAETPGPIYAPVAGNFVRDALDRGYRLGFVGSGDRHDGHPGAYQRDPPQGGLAAIVAEERTRESVLAALRERRVYATNGARILLRTALGPHRMGSVVSVGASGLLTDSLYVSVVAERPLERVELIRSGEVVDGVLTEGRLEVTLQREVADLAPGEYVYVRAVQEDEGAAWSSPIFISEAASTGAE